MGGQRAVRVLTVEVWLTIDATLDNVAHNAVDSYDEELAARARVLRERGWEVNARHPERGLGPVGWPPRAARFEIELSDADLAFIRSHVDAAIPGTQSIVELSWLDSTERTLQEQSLASLREARDAIDVINQVK